jgi:hypothetical protein
MFHRAKTWGSSFDETSMSPSSAKLMKPLSNKWSMWGDRSNPLLPSSFSEFVDSRQGFM